MKNKTIAAWLTFLGGPLGLHRFYLRGLGDMLGWLLPIPTALGLYGLERVQQFGLDDQWSWVLIPLAGFTFAGCALTAIVYGLMTPEKWECALQSYGRTGRGSGQYQLVHGSGVGSVPVDRIHGADGQPGFQLRALFRLPDPGRPEDFAVASKRWRKTARG